MLLSTLREQFLQANLELIRGGRVPSTFGNVSAVDRAKGRVAIKPSGVPYEALIPAQVVISDLAGEIIDGTLRAPSDVPTHLEFPDIGGDAHTHSEFATAWAQAETPIPCLGTTHTDYFHGPVPVAERLRAT